MAYHELAGRHKNKILNDASQWRGLTATSTFLANEISMPFIVSQRACTICHWARFNKTNPFSNLGIFPFPKEIDSNWYHFFLSFCPLIDDKTKR